MSNFLSDIRYALRGFVKAPAVPVVVILTLAIGVGANAAIFSVLHAVVLRDLPYRDADRLALLWTVNQRQDLLDGSSYLNVRDWREQSRTFEDMAVYRRPEFTRTTVGGEVPERIQIALVGPRFFSVLGGQPLLGRTLEPDDFEAGRAVVISDRFWRQRFAASRSVIGASIPVDGMLCNIVGVMAPEFQFPTSEVQLWRPISVLPIWDRLRNDPRSRDADMLMVVGRLSPTATFDAARAELDTIAASLREAYPDSNGGRGVFIEPLSDHVLGQRTATSVWLLFGAVSFVLLIACSNVANLGLARSTGRRNEFSIRAALGARRGRLLQQALTEQLILSLAAAVVGVLLAWLLTAVLRTWGAGALPRLAEVELNTSVLVFGLAIAVVAGLLAGLIPAMQLSTLNLVTIVSHGRVGSAGRAGLRRGLVILELSLAVALLAGAGVMVRSYVRVQTAERGFDSRQVLLLQIDLPASYDNAARREAYYRAALARVRALPSVVAAGAVTDFFVQRHPDARIAPEGHPRRKPDDPAPPLTQDFVLPGFLEALRITPLRGRLLTEQDIDPAALPVAMINETLARRFWPGEDPVGRRFKFGLDPEAKGPWITIVGIVPDMRRRRLDEAAIPYIFRPGVRSEMDVIVRTAGDPAGMSAAIRAALQEIDATVPPYGFTTVEERLGETVALRTLQTVLLAALAAAALALAVIGVYGIVHYFVRARTREIGVRLALGASRAAVVWHVLSEAAGMVAVGLVLGTIGALALSRTVSAYLYETSALDPVIYIGVAGLLIAATVIACVLPARRAARIDPMAVLRQE